MKTRFLDQLMGVLLTSGLALAGWGIIVAPDEPNSSEWAWNWSWSLQNQ
jgi:hypothetical protein